MNTQFPLSPKPVSRNFIFKKWKTWCNRLQNEFVNLLVQQRHFHELRAITKPYIGTEKAAELARSMAQGYVAFALTAIRRLAEFPKSNTPKSREIVSLPTLLMDIQANAHLITRKHQRQRYKKAMKHAPEFSYISAADRVHDAVSNGDDVLQAASVERDLRLINRAVRRIGKLTDKVQAHIERDRRRIPRNFGFEEVDVAIKVLFDALEKYSLCLFGKGVLIPEIEDFSIVDDLRKVWPGNTSLPEFPSVHDEVDV